MPTDVSHDEGPRAGLETAVGTYDSRRMKMKEAQQLHVWFHETRISSSDVLVYPNVLKGAKDGDLAELQPLEGSSRRLLFIVKTVDEELQKKLPNFEISLQAGSLQALLDLTPRSPVLVRLRSRTEDEADLVEIYCRDMYLTRYDQWRLAQQLVGNCVYRTQKIVFMNSIRCSVNGIFRRGRKVFSAYIGPQTKVVFRSESAKLVFLVQMSKEMWHFEESGDIIFQKVVNSIFPEIFKRWKEIGAHHVITIVLFTTVDISSAKKVPEAGRRPDHTKDYFRVVVDQIHVNNWNEIMVALRREFARFERDVRIQKVGETLEIEGSIVSAIKGNLLEAINLATSLVVDHFKDPDLRLTNHHFVVITPGTGIFDIDYDLLYLTSKKMLGIEVGVDIICLSRPPLHVIPLFRYRDPADDSKLRHCIPNWIDISYWNTMEKFSNQWIPRCKIYELQMMGVMENEMTAISIDNLALNRRARTAQQAMDSYDEEVFAPAGAKADTTTASQASSYADLPQLRLAKSSPGPAPSRLSVELSRVSSVSSISSSASSSSSASVGPVVYHRGVVPATAAPSVSTVFLSSDAAGSVPVLRRPEVTARMSLLQLREQKPKETADSSRSANPVHHPVTRTMSSARLITDSRADQPIIISSRTRSPMILRRGRDGGAVRVSAFGNVVRKPVSGPSAAGMAKSTNTMTISTARELKDPEPRETDNPARQTKPLGKPSLTPVSSHHIMWTPIENPSRTINEQLVSIYTYGRWQHTFPDNVKRRIVKWRSLSSPATIPITTAIFPMPDDFQFNYTFQIYDVAMNPDYMDRMTTRELMREMVGLRLIMGFQICTGNLVKKVESKRKPGGNPQAIVTAIPEDYFGCRIYMALDDQIHRISCDYYGNINVQLYRRTSSDVPTGGVTSYHPLVRTRYNDTFWRAKTDTFNNLPPTLNWNQFDQILAGYREGMSFGDQIFRMKVIFVPADATKTAMFSGNSEMEQEKLTNEEIHIEGLRRLMALIYKSRYVSKEEASRSSGKRKDATPVINFYTGDLFRFLQQQIEINNTSIRHGAPRKKESIFVNNHERFKISIKLSQLAQEMQSPKGVTFVDRRWHWKLHRNCFLGQEFVSWILENFSDVDTREEAVHFGNHLMEEGLFHHVENRHGFLDGHYFYQLNPEFDTSGNADARSSWFSKTSTSAQQQRSSSDARSGSVDRSRSNSVATQGSRSKLKQGRNPSVESDELLGHVADGQGQPASDILKRVLTTEAREREKERTNERMAQTEQDKEDRTETGRETPKQLLKAASKLSIDMARGDSTGSFPTGKKKDPPKEKLKVMLSKAIEYDMDTQRKSDRPEIVQVHYDSVHNPEHAFRLRLEWLNVTPKLIDENIGIWSRTCERYGLKMIQVPWREISSIPSSNPFHSMIYIELALNPWTDDEFRGPGVSKSPDSPAVCSPLSPSTVVEPVAVNKKFYHIHLLEHCGFVLDGSSYKEYESPDFEILFSWGKPSFKYSQFVHTSGGYIAQIRDDGKFVLAPNNSHLARVNVPTEVSHLQQAQVDAESVFREFKSFCEDKQRLREFFRSARKAWISGNGCEDMVYDNLSLN